jgi:hypothetical protein
MFNDVFNFLTDKYKEKAFINKQRVSIGIEFYADIDGDIIKIDVVPGRELNKDQYKEDNKLNLFIYKQFGKYQAGSDRIQSNIKAQIDNIRDRSTNEKDSIRKTVRLLKVWKDYQQKDLISFFIELITRKAFDNKTISGDIWQQLKAVMEYIRDNVKEVCLKDPGNSNNDVADTLSDAQKSILSDDMKFMLERIQSDSDNIKNYFPVNEKHPCDDDSKSNNEYSVKAEGISIPPTLRFG